jgi:putative Mn2+ efflux pump MntP
MLKVLLFSFSISLDAFGYALGFGSKNIKINKLQFLFLNIINSVILITFLTVYPMLAFLSLSNFAHNASGILLALVGAFDMFVAIRALFVSHRSFHFECFLKTFKLTQKFMLFDIILILSIFVFENLFSTFVFYSSLGSLVFFVSLSFCLHYLFFLIGYDIAQKVKNVLPVDANFLSGSIFLFMALLNFAE